MGDGVEEKARKVDRGHNPACFVKYNHLRVTVKRRHEHLGEQFNVLDLFGHSKHAFLRCVAKLHREAS